MITHNHDVVGLCSRLERFIQECHKSQSSGHSDMNSFDINRLISYLDGVDTYRLYIVGAPQLDLPETSPRAYEMADPVVLPAVENEMVNDMIRMMELMRDELMNSQSSRQATGLNMHDNVRLEAAINRGRRFMSDYVLKIAPLDLPESSPKRASSGVGRTGVMVGA